MMMMGTPVLLFDLFKFILQILLHLYVQYKTVQSINVFLFFDHLSKNLKTRTGYLQGQICREVHSTSPVCRGTSCCPLPHWQNLLSYSLVPSRTNRKQILDNPFC